MDVDEEALAVYRSLFVGASIDQAMSETKDTALSAGGKLCSSKEGGRQEENLAEAAEYRVVDHGGTDLR